MGKGSGLDTFVLENAQPFPTLSPAQLLIEGRFTGRNNFKRVAGLTLPHTYILTFTASGRYGTTIIEWRNQAVEILHNQQLDPGAFTVY